MEQRLGDVVRNPLLFTLALVLTAQGQHADSRAELFEGFVSRLQKRSEGIVLSAATRAGAEAACCDLRREGRYSADRWWWLDRLTAVRDELVTRGTIASAGLAADEQLAELETLGLVRSVSDADFELGLLHDLFCDWLASEAVRHGLRALPDPVPEPLEESVVFLAERAALDHEQLLAVAGNAVAAVRVADALPAAELDPELADAIWRRLRVQLAPALATRLQGGCDRTESRWRGENEPIAPMKFTFREWSRTEANSCEGLRPRAGSVRFCSRMFGGRTVAERLQRIPRSLAGRLRSCERRRLERHGPAVVDATFFWPPRVAAEFVYSATVRPHRGLSLDRVAMLLESIEFR
jgi:hypothetical protein